MHKTLTSDEFYDKYGNVKVKFESYYKYTFTYRGVLENGNTIVIDCGGDSDTIYKHDVGVGVEVSITTLSPYYAAVFDKNKDLVEMYRENC